MGQACIFEKLKKENEKNPDNLFHSLFHFVLRVLFLRMLINSNISPSVIVNIIRLRLPVNFSCATVNRALSLI